jgi:hypothetical protein
MRKVIYILFFVVFPLILFGQEKAPSLKNAQKEKNPAAKVSDAKSDTTGKNMGNLRGRRYQMRKRMQDSFQDKDGDGINDCRAKGMRWSGNGAQGGGPRGKGQHKGLGRHGRNYSADSTN